uniref:sn-1-specific diacylglycerol lipase ABHD11 n=1 Tax=Schistocephalus solidus TaxID=70667 RepID=A0A0X3P9M9_SCHSO
MSKLLALAYSAYTLQTAKFKEPIIILHGLLGNKRNWRSFANDLIQRSFGQIFCVDLRNHGDSPHSQDFNYLTMADDLVKFIRDRRLSNVSLLGHSMGGKVAMVTALREVLCVLLPCFLIAVSHFIPFFQMRFSYVRSVRN